MGSVLVDNVQFNTTAGGADAFEFSAAAVGHRPLTVAPVGVALSYVARSEDNSEWECGVGVFDGDATLTRDTILYSSNSDTIVSFSNPPVVSLTAYAADLESSTQKYFTIPGVTASNGFYNDFEILNDPHVTVIGSGGIVGHMEHLVVDNCPNLDRIEFIGALFGLTLDNVPNLTTFAHIVPSSFYAGEYEDSSYGTFSVNAPFLQYFTVKGDEDNGHSVATTADMDFSSVTEGFTLELNSVNSDLGIHTVTLPDTVTGLYLTACYLAVDYAAVSMLEEIVATDVYDDSDQFALPDMADLTALSRLGLINVNLAVSTLAAMQSINSVALVNVGNLTTVDISGAISGAFDAQGCADLQSVSVAFSSSVNTATVTGCSALESVTLTGSGMAAPIFEDSFDVLETVSIVGAALIPPAVDAILVGLAGNSVSNGTVDLSGGTSAAPSSTGLAAKSTLQGRGWTVTTN